LSSQSTLAALKQQIASGEAARDEALAHENAACENHASLTTQASELQASLESLQQAEQAQRQRHEEITKEATELETKHTERQQALAAQAAETQQKIDELENRLAALEEWLLRMQDCHKRLADLPPEPLEARNMRNEIEMAMASLSHLLSSRARVAFRPPAAALAHPTQEARAGRITGTFTMPDKPDT
jgi:chromosome segregation ATPase